MAHSDYLDWSDPYNEPDPYAVQRAGAAARAAVTGGAPEAPLLSVREQMEKFLTEQIHHAESEIAKAQRLMDDASIKVRTLRVAREALRRIVDQRSNSFNQLWRAIPGQTTRIIGRSLLASAAASPALEPRR